MPNIHACCVTHYQILPIACELSAYPPACNMLCVEQDLSVTWVVQVVSLGTHIVDPALGGAMLLMEVMPSVLARRSFPPPATHEAIEPGYRDSPDPSENMALVFTKALPCSPNVHLDCICNVMCPSPVLQNVINTRCSSHWLCRWLQKFLSSLKRTSIPRCMQRRHMHT